MLFNYKFLRSTKPKVQCSSPCTPANENALPSPDKPTSDIIENLQSALDSFSALRAQLNKSISAYVF